MAVPFLDLKRQYAGIRSEIEPALLALCESQQFVLGETVESFEKAVAEYLGAPYAVGCASGTDALILCLAALDAGPGDEVITTPFSFFATASCIWRVGARPVFADIDPATFNISPESVEKAVSDKTKAVLPVHLYGQCADTEALQQIASERDILMVEDACQAIGAQRNGKKAGAIGDCAAFSFYPTKNLGGFGDGGIVTTCDEGIAARVRSLRVHGETSRYVHEKVGVNSRLDAIQALVLHKKLKYLDEWNRKRAENASTYNEILSHPEIVTPAVGAGNNHIYHQYVIRVKNGKRDQVAAHLRASGVGSAIFYPIPLHLQRCFASLGYRKGDLPESERAAAEVIALPVFAELTQSEIQEVAERILEAL